MSGLLIVGIVLAASGLIAVPVAMIAASRHKKAAVRELDLVGAKATVETSLEAEGSILLDGELWRAHARTGAPVERGRRVRVVGASGHLLEVEPVE